VVAPGQPALADIRARFGDEVLDDAGRLDRKALGARVFGDAEAMRRLERILHPLVRQDSARFLKEARKRGARLAVLDVPLLFEVGRDRDCDATLVVSAPPFVQRARVLARPGMSERRFHEVLARQMPDAEKRRRADHVVPTGLGRRLTLRRLQRVLKDVQRSGVKGKRRRRA
jgi:dephospho-CoA kinase